MPFEEEIDTSSKDNEKNLFENFTAFDLSPLIGSAFIIPKTGGMSDHVIKPLDPFFSREFEYCNASPESRLEALFKIKDRWTKCELEAYVAPFIDLTAKFDTYLMKNTRMIRDKNPFDHTKEVAYYLRKF